ncbi:MAG: TlpA family protein disulfide reductase [Bacteroidetes bacterium]|nr:MAG: TlpA family protein disulfide reductase [Bacteroidota bacterium]
MILCSGSCVVIENQFEALPPGIWRGALMLEQQAVPVEAMPQKKKYFQEIPKRVSEAIPEGMLPFNFEVIYDESGGFHIEIINGNERIPVPDVSFGRSKSRAKDSIRIDFPVYETYIIAFYEDNDLEGYWYVPARGSNYRIPFSAKYGKDYRFTPLKEPPAADLTGRWEVLFSEEDGSTFPAVGEFTQSGNHLSGTFLTETGDYRFLDGTVQGDHLYLSCFDGSHAFLFDAKINPDETLTGAFRSGVHYKATWSAKRNSEATLKNPYDLTSLVDGYETVQFSFPSPDGRLISPDSEEYRGKVKIIQIFGTWCPNCRDETAFLVEYLNEHPHPDLKVIGLAFEKHREKEKAFERIRTWQAHFKMNYDIAFAGYYDKEEAAKALPMLNHVLSYPTLIFLDKNNKVRKIHTGFAGPATAEYEAFKAEFDELVNKLLAE